MTDATENNVEDKKGLPWGIILIGLLAIIVLWLVVGILVPSHCEKIGSEKMGLFGDQFGAVNSLFSALAFLGLIVAIFLQGRELKLQRNELRLQRQEYQNQIKVWEQNKCELERSASAQEKNLEHDKLATTIRAAETLVQGYVLQKKTILSRPIVSKIPGQKEILEKQRKEKLEEIDLKISEVSKITQKMQEKWFQDLMSET